MGIAAKGHPLQWGELHSGGIIGGLGTYRPSYASRLPGTATIPGSSGAQTTERVRIGLLNLAGRVSNWLGGLRRGSVTPSPVDLYNGEIITRFGDFPSASRPFPYPYMIGAVSGFCELLDSYSLAYSWGKTPSGPGVATPIPIPWDAQYPTLPKVTG